MTDIILPDPGRDYTLVPTLSLIETLERDASLLKTAEKLLAHELKTAEALYMLRACYKAAGCEVAAAELDAFLLPRAPMTMLAGILAKILTPLAEMGLVKPGEAKAGKQKARRA